MRVGSDNSANNANTMQYGPVQHGHAHQARSAGAKCWHCWLLKTDSQQCQQSTGSQPDVVGTANNANMVCLLHELTIVSLLHELSMVAGGQVAGREGGEGPGRGPTVTEASRTNFFCYTVQHTPLAQENQCSNHCH